MFESSYTDGHTTIVNLVIQVVVMVMSASSMAETNLKAEWNSAIMVDGQQCALLIGKKGKQEWCVDSWGSTQKVSGP